MVRGYLTALAAAALLLGARAPDDLRSALRDTADLYATKLPEIASETSRDTTLDYYQRLTDDLEMLDVPTPRGYTGEQWQRSADAISTLDLSLARQLLDRTYRPMASIRGLGETLIRASKDGTMQPVAVYVPTTYQPSHPASLIVMLHGRPQPETSLLGLSFINDLAERTGTIVIAPYARGYYDYQGTESDVYDALDAAEKAFAVDPRRRYLVGYSMGGFSVFSVAPLRPQVWAAIMCVAGGLRGSLAYRVTSTLRTRPFYVLTGSDDSEIPTAYPTTTAAYLREFGMDVSFYSELGGRHGLITLLPILTQAWNDMESGIVRTPPAGLVDAPLPWNMPPVDAVKP